MAKRVKFQTVAKAEQALTALHASQKIGAWNVTQAGYARYFDVAGRVWRDFIQFDAERFEVSL